MTLRIDICYAMPGREALYKEASELNPATDPAEIAAIIYKKAEANPFAVIGWTLDNGNGHTISGEFNSDNPADSRALVESDIRELMEDW